MDFPRWIRPDMIIDLLIVARLFGTLVYDGNHGSKEWLSRPLVLSYLFILPLGLIDRITGMDYRGKEGYLNVTFSAYRKKTTLQVRDATDVL